MKTINFVVLIAAGILIALIYFATCNKTLPPAPVIPTVREQIKIVTVHEETYKKKFDSLQAINKQLAIKSADLKAKLHGEQQRSMAMENFINDLPLTPESKEAVNDYVANNHSKDSTTNELLFDMEGQLLNKESIIAAHDSLYIQLKRSFDVAVDNQGKLTDYSNALKKQLRWKKIGNTVWKSAAVVAGLIILKNTLK